MGQQCILHKSIPLPTCTSQNPCSLIRTFASSAGAFWLKFEIFSEDGIAIKGFKVEMYKTKEGGVQMRHEEQAEDRVPRNCAVICWSQPDQTDNFPLTPSVITEPDLAPFFLSVSNMVTTECLDDL